MKALSLTQPWATLVAIGTKRIETRSWQTSFRGRIYIHAAKKFPRWAQDLAQETQPFADVLNRPNEELPRGALVAIANLVSIYRTETDIMMDPQERAFGDYTPGRFAWVLEDVEPLQHPIPYRGALGLFNVDLPTPDGEVDEALWGIQTDGLGHVLPHKAQEV